MASLNVTHCVFHFTSTITFNLFLFETRFVNIQLHLVSQEHVIVIKPVQFSVASETDYLRQIFDNSKT